MRRIYLVIGLMLLALPHLSYGFDSLPTAIPNGTDGQVLTARANDTPHWAAPSGGPATTPIYVGTATGTADAITLAPATALNAYTTGQTYIFTAGASANTTTTPTLNISSLGAKTIVKQNGGGALQVGDIQASRICIAIYNGTNMELITEGPSIYIGWATFPPTAGTYTVSGVGFKPRLVYITSGVSTGGAGASYGVGNGTNNYSSYLKASSSSSFSSSTKSVSLDNGSGVTLTGTISSLTSDGFILTYDNTAGFNYIEHVFICIR